VIVLLTLAALAAPDRSRPPEVAPPTLLVHPQPQSFGLHPGAELRLIPTPGSTKVALTLLLGGGGFELGKDDPTTWGAMAYLWDAATTSRTADALSIERDIEQIELWSGGGAHRTTLSFVAPRERVDKALEMLADVLHNPAWPATELKLYKVDQTNWYLYEALNDPATVSSSALRYAWYPADSYYGRRPDITALKKIKTSGMQADHKELLRSTPAVVLVAGDISAEDLKPALGKMLAEVGVDKPLGRPYSSAIPAGTRVLAVNLPGAEQASIRLRMQAPTYHDPDSVAFEAVNWAVGGAFLSRLNKNLREDKGWTYGIGSSYSADVVSGVWGASVMVATENAGDAITEIGKEIDLVVASGITAEEISGGWREEAASWNNVFLDVEGVVDLYDDLIWKEETIDQRRARIDGRRTVTPEATQNVAARWLGADASRLWVVVGDRKTLEPELATIGLSPQWIEADRAVLGDFELQSKP
jgi:zinc protease